MITIWKTPIVATVEQVLKDLKLQLYGAGLLKEIKNTGSDLMCTCPFHAHGKEHNPSCGVLLQQKVTKDKTYEAGTVHCYTCGYTADLPQFVADLLGLSSPVEGFKWLVNQYNYQTEERELPDLDMYRGSTAKSSVLEESLVKQYTQNLLQSEEACRYLHKRRIANWVLEAYELGFDPEDKTVLFPVRGMDGKVIFYKGRSIAGKHFYNAKEVDKTSVVFGLWEILNGSFSWGTSDQIEEVWITESEIDALSLISYGVPAVAIMGSHISEDQCKELERTPFRRFVIATDNDDAGRKGASQIKRLLIIRTPERLKEVMETYLTGVSEYVLDVETTGLDVYNDILVGICLYNPDLPSFYVPFNHTDLQNKRVEGQMTEEECKAVMLPYLANGSLKCINHNIKFDDKVVTFQWGQRIANVWWDTNIAGWVLNENEKHGLKPMYNKYILNGEGSDEDFGDLFEGIPCNYIPIDIFAIYGANDGFKTWALPYCR